MKIFFSPDYPNKEFFGLTHIINHLGYDVTVDPNQSSDVGFLWCDSTYLNCPEVLLRLNKKQPVLNIGCTDISKSMVDKIGKKVFGYSNFLNPTRYQGLCVEKPDENGVKGGNVIECPIKKPKIGFIYQHLIDSTIDGYQQEFRVPVILGTLPIVSLVKLLPATASLDFRKQMAPIPMSVDVVFNDKEQQQIITFCQYIKLDFGELDIVRCRHTQRLFILDANKTPGGYGMLNYFHWQRDDKLKVIDTLANAFDQQIKKLLNRK